MTILRSKGTASVRSASVSNAGCYSALLMSLIASGCWHGSSDGSSTSTKSATPQHEARTTDLGAPLPKSLEELQTSLRTEGRRLLQRCVVGDVIVDRADRRVVTVQGSDITPYLEKWDVLLRDDSRMSISCLRTIRDLVCFQLGEPELYFHFSDTLPSIQLIGVTEITGSAPPANSPAGPVQIIPL